MKHWESQYLQFHNLMMTMTMMTNAFLEASWLGTIGLIMFQVFVSQHLQQLLVEWLILQWHKNRSQEAASFSIFTLAQFLLSTISEKYGTTQSKNPPQKSKFSVHCQNMELWWFLADYYFWRLLCYYTLCTVMYCTVLYCVVIYSIVPKLGFK